MTPEKGHFEQGRWVIEKEPASPHNGSGVAIETRLADATKSVISSIDDVMNVTRDLVTTEEGKQYIEKTIRDTEKQIQKSFDEILVRVKKELEKKKK